MTEEIKVDLVADDQISAALSNVAKEIAKFSRNTNTALENIGDSLGAVADAAKGMGTGVAQGAKQGTAELKNLEAQAKQTAKNIDSRASQDGKLTRFGPKVQGIQANPRPEASQVKLTQGGTKALDMEKQLTAEMQKQAQLDQEKLARLDKFKKGKDFEAAKAESGLKLDEQRKKALKDQERILKEQGRSESEKINKIAIANTLFVRQEKLLDGTATQAQIMERAISRVTPAVQASISALPRLRYALFDVGRGAAILSAALTAVAVAPAGIAISFRREFADVERTTGLAGEEAEALRQDFIRLKQDIPISWEEITDIGSLAGQLGISSALIADFSASVARFSATTDLNVEQSATLFGRLNQLITGVNGQFEKLGSAINRVGVISVATESQIGSIAQNIAAIANLSNFAADEIIGLSGAIASLGIAPERARGTITRLFTNINRAVSQSGRSLEEYGRLTGQTAEDFANSWGDSPAEALVGFFKGIDEEGSRAEKTLSELGITSARDVPAILALAQGSELVGQLISESADAFEKGTESQEQYSRITSTVAERLSLLAGNFKLLVAVVGDSSNSLGPLVDVANDFVKTLIAISNNDVAKWAFFAAGAFTLLLAGLAGLIAIFAISGAKVAGFVTALTDAQRSMLGFGAAAKISSMGLMGFVRAQTAAIARTKLFINTLKSFAFFAAFQLVFLAVGAAIAVYTKATRSAAEASREAFGEISSFTEAVNADTKAYRNGADAITVRTKSVVEDADAIDTARLATAAWARAQDDAEGSTEGLTEKVREQITAFGDQALEVGLSLALNENSEVGGLVSDLANDPGTVAALDSLGFTLEELIRKSFDGKGEEYALGFIDDINNSIAANQGMLSEIDSLALSGQTLSPEQLAERERLVSVINEEARVTAALRKQLIPTAQAYDTTSDAAMEAGNAVDFVTKRMDGQEESAAFTSESINQLIDDYFGAANAARATEGSIEALGTAFAESGEDALFSSEEIQGVINSILTESGNATIAVEQLGGFMALLASMGIDVTGPALEYVRGIMGELGFATALTNDEVINLTNGLGGLAGFDSFSAAFKRGAEEIKTSSSGAKKEVKSFSDQMKELIGTLFEFTNQQQAASDAIFNLGAAFAESGDEALYAGSEIQSAITAIVQSSADGDQAVANLSGLLGTLAGSSGVSSASLDVLREVIQAVGENAGLSAQRIQELIQTAGSGTATVAFGNFARGVSSANQEVRTLLDYAGDLTGIFTRSFDIRFKSVLNMDSITSSWEDLNKEVDDVTRSLATLSADRSVKEYFLSVAEAYGDDLRADTIRAELADIEKEIKEAQDSLSREVAGDSTAARNNRKTITDLVSEYQEYIGSLAESGASQDELRAAVERSRSDFEEQARQLGFSEQVIQQYGAAFDDVRTAIDNVPRNITVEANVNPALQALNELNASLQKQISAANDLNRALNQPVSTPTPTPTPTPTTTPAFTQPGFRPTPLLPGGSRTPVGDVLFGRNARVTITGSSPRFTIPTGPSSPYSFSDGGFTGRGGMMQPAGVVHKGEYVVPQKYVNQSTGLPDANFLSQLQNGMRSFAMGGFVGRQSGSNDGGTMMVELSPFDRKLLSDAGNVQLRLNGKIVAEATNSNNLNDARRGSN